MSIKTLVGYDIVPGVSEEEYEDWLFNIHAPDLLANPYLDRIVFNKILRRVEQASGGSTDIPVGYTFYRIAEMHYADETAYENYLAWFVEHPMLRERGPAGRTDFKFYLVSESTEVTR
ncbi:MAG: hypothetical protein ABI382_10335 [Nakamurella sp.]